MSKLSKKGLGFQDRQVYECYMMSAIDASDKGGEDLNEDAASDHPTIDVKLKDAPFELEDEGQATIDELVEINLGSEDDPKTHFLKCTINSRRKRSHTKHSCRLHRLFCMELQRDAGS